MEEIRKIKSYVEFKQELDREMNVAANSFCRIGYLLRIAEDTNILHESGYKSLNEFAKAEYGLSADMVSRYIRINKKYSEDGYSEKLAAGYEQYGVAKLAEMITLPDTVADAITPDMSKMQIQDIRKEIREEEKITDIEVAIEEDENRIDNDSLLDLWLFAYLEEKKDLFQKIRTAIRIERRNADATKKELYQTLCELLAPSGVAMLPARPKGYRKMLLSIHGPESNVSLINPITGETSSYTWEDIAVSYENIFGLDGKTADAWERVFGSPWEEEKIAPVQSKSKPEPTLATEASESEEQIPGQTTLTPEGEVVDTPKEENIKQEIGNGRTEEEAMQVAAEEEFQKRIKDGSIRQIHYLKLSENFFEDVLCGRKTFELRKNDRNYKIGDTLILQEYASGKFTGAAIEAPVIYMLEEFTGLTDGYCILGIEIKSKGKIESSNYIALEDGGE